jgi:hypothetical protein
MSIIKEPDASQPAPATGKGPKKPVMRGTRRQIALTFPPATIDQIDATAARFGMTRAGYINRAVVKALEADM